MQIWFVCVFSWVQSLIDRWGILYDLNGLNRTRYISSDNKQIKTKCSDHICLNLQTFYKNDPLVKTRIFMHIFFLPRVYNFHKFAQFSVRMQFNFLNRHFTFDEWNFGSNNWWAAAEEEKNGLLSNNIGSTRSKRNANSWIFK